jgi:hypothetical protein
MNPRFEEAPNDTCVNNKPRRHGRPYFSACLHAQQATTSSEEAVDIARETYVYAYPFLLQELTREQVTNVAAPNFPHAPTNQLAHAPAFPPAEMKVVVRPNADTLYSVGWVDTGPEPVVLSVPATDRYFMLPMLSLWSDVFAVPGTRTTGRNRAVNFVIVGPKWQGDVPAGLELIRAPTRQFGIIGRTQANGPSDYENVHKVQAGIKLTPLSAWGKADFAPAKAAVNPAIDMKTTPPDQVDKMTAAIFLKRFTELLNDNPPNAVDYPILHRMARIGIKIGNTFDLDAAPAAIKTAVEQGFADGKKLILEENAKVSGAKSKGWAYTLNSGTYGTNYLYRAGIAYCCLGENLPEDAVYPSAATDTEGRPFDGNASYVLHFDKGKLPPVNAFWSVTAYDKDGYFIPNPLNRFTMGDRSNFNANPDRSVDIYIQSDNPGGPREANWLPVAKAPFNLLLRLYSPKAEFLEGRWSPPDVKRSN